MLFEQGQVVARVKKRYNPQIGDYYTVKQVLIKTANGTGYSVEIDGLTEKYDLAGNRKNIPDPIHESSTFFIVSLEEATQYDQTK